MSELSVGRPGDGQHQPPPSGDDRQRRRAEPVPEAERHAPPGGAAIGAEELALAFGAAGPVHARLEYDDAGRPLARVVDLVRGETVALLTLDELRALTEATGLPAGMFIQAET